MSTNSSLTLPKRYHPIVVTLHWLVAILIFVTALLANDGEGERGRSRPGSQPGNQQGTSQQGNPPQQGFQPESNNGGSSQNTGTFPIIGIHMILGISVIILLYNTAHCTLAYSTSEMGKYG